MINIINKREKRDGQLWAHRPFITYCEYHIKQFAETSRAISRVVVATVDGIKVVAYPYDLDEYVIERLGAIGSTMHALSESSIKELGLNKCRSIEIEADRGRIWIGGLKIEEEEFILLIESPEKAVHGELLYYANQMRQKIEEFTA